jgi:hypothetical protein
VTSRTTTFEPPLTLTADGPLPLPTYVITCPLPSNVTSSASIWIQLLESDVSTSFASV